MPDDFASRISRRLAVRFDVDLGELAEGHHVVACGLEFGQTGTVLHYEFVPGLVAGRPLRERVNLQCWSVHTEDGAGAVYSDPDGGAFAGGGGPDPTHGERDLGGHTPSSATQRRIEITLRSDWIPPGGWVRQLTIDLITGHTTTLTMP